MKNQEQDTFDHLLSRMEPDLASRDAQYGRLRMKMFRFFEWRRCQDGWELADETIARLVKNVRSGVYVQSYSYIYTIATNVFREHRRSVQKNEGMLANLTPPVQVLDRLLDCRRRCLEQLERDKRELLEQYYAGKETSDELAELTGTTVRNLRLRIHRIKKKLIECCNDCEKKPGQQ